MIEDRRTLVVLADGRRVRLFEESRLGGPLKEQKGWLRTLPPFQHPGGGGHSAHDPLRDKGERQFLSDLAGHLEDVMRDQNLDELVIVAPPRALGILRKALPRALEQRLAATDPHDRLDASLDEVQHHLRATRLQASE